MSIYLEKLEERLKTTIMLLKNLKVRESRLLDKIYIYKCDYWCGEKLPALDCFESFTNGEVWAKEKDKHAWFYFQVKIDNALEGCRNSVYIDLTPCWDPVRPQGVVYVNGQLMCGVGVNHNEIYFDKPGVYDVYIYAYSGATVYEWWEDNRDIKLTVRQVTIDNNIEKLYYDLLAPWEVVSYTEKYSKAYSDIMGALNNAINQLNLIEYYSDEFNRSVVLASKALVDVYGQFTQEQVVAVGHTHIDIVWLWSYRQTREKVVRSFATVIYLMNKYPEYKFMSSQAELYNIVKEDAPQLYEQIKERVAEGRWEVEGSMWVEADCILTSGESLVRQIIYGKQFFKEEFGVDTKTLWLPDVFGYTAALPQILRQSGVDKFVTSKISWNDTNQMPYDILDWYGIDGSSVFTYFLTAQDKRLSQNPVNYTLYTGNTNSQMIAGTFERVQQKELTDQALLTFGWGDGGGGPTPDMLERLRRTSKGVENCPTTAIKTTAEFFQDIMPKAIVNKDFPKWYGEFYLEYHRGTYTNNAQIKRNNRKAEFALQNVEFLCSVDEILNHRAYPFERIKDVWHLLMLQQFHDALPGTAIEEVYQDSREDFDKIFSTLEELQEVATRGILSAISSDKQYIAVNPLSYWVTAPLLVDGLCYEVENISPKGCTGFDLFIRESCVTATESKLENDFYIVEFDEQGKIFKLFDKKRGRELLQENAKGNVFEVHEDYPFEYDGWELREYHKEKIYVVDNLISREIVRQGDRTGITFKYVFSHSTIEQTVWLYNKTPRVDFDTKVDWANEHVCLKVFFPFEVNTTKATYDIQFGNIERGTTKNTSWDRAKFEVYGHKFVDLSESDYGVALLNDCKYGYEVYGADVKLTLLRGATYPNANSDKGMHYFTYSIYAHEGALNNSDVAKQAFLLNNPPIVIKNEYVGSQSIESYSFVETSDERIVVDSIKRSEDKKGYVVRTYENTNATVTAKIVFTNKIKKIYRCDLLENKQEQISDCNICEITYKPYKIVSLYIEL